MAEGRSPRWSPGGQWLYFLRDGKLLRARPDGTDLQRVGFPGLISPSGDRLAYPLEGGIRVAAPDGSQARELLPAGSDVQRFLWSPDGSRLVVERERRLSRQPPSEWGLWLVNADGSGLSLLHSAWDPQQPYSTGSCLGTWSPDGAYLSFWRCGVSGSISADGGHLLVIPVQGGDPKRIGQTLFYQDFLSWSPDGQLLAFVDPGGRDTWGYFPEGKPQGKQIKVAETASGQVWDVTADPTRTHLYPSFSPDAKGIAYSSAPVVPYDRQYPKAEGAGARRIWVINTDGGGKRQLTDDPGYADERPLWSRDGGYILFARRLAVEWEEKDLKAELWLMRADGSDKRRGAEGLDGGSPWFGYYGHINWDDLFAWHQGG